MVSGWINGKAMVSIFLCATLVVLSAPVRGQDAGPALYKTKCAACHGPDGKGETAIGKANKLRGLGSSDVQKQSDAELAAFIENGKGKMPAYGKSLKPEQVKDLVTYVRSFAKK
jgi:cytochrome c6